MSARQLSLLLGHAENFVHRVESGERMLDACEFVDYVRAAKGDPVRIIEEMAAQPSKK